MLQLITTLKELIVILEKLINLAERKKVVLVERKVDELNQLVQEEAKIVKQLNQVDQEREKLVESVMKNHPSLSFSQFVEQLPDELTSKNLQSKLKTLQQLMMELHDINKVNESLIEDSVNFVQHMIEHITKSKQQHFNYQSPIGQQKSQTSNRGFFDTKA